MKTQLLAASAAAASVFGAGIAHADSTFYFTGTCSDCSNPLGVLTLSDNEANPTISSSNFVSFVYTSNKADYTFDSGSDVSGQLATLPGPNETSFSNKSVSGPNSDISFNFGDFYSHADGTWNFSLDNEGLDGGTNGTWSTTMPSDVSSAPEPATWAMMAGGVAAMGAALRGARRRRPLRAAA